MASKMLRLAPDLQDRVDDMQKKYFRHLNIGIQIRVKKTYVGIDPTSPEVFFTVAKMIQQSHGVSDANTSFFITTDEPKLQDMAKQILGENNVWFTGEGRSLQLLLFSTL